MHGVTSYGAISYSAASYCSRMRHVLPQLAIMLLLGVCALQLQPDLMVPIWTSPELLIFLPLCLWLFYLLPAHRCLIAFFIGYLWALLFAHIYLQQRLPEELSGQDILLQGVVRGVPDITENSLRFDFQVTDYLLINDAQYQSDLQALPSKLRLSWYYHQQAIKTGEHWQFLVRLKPPHGMHNPGGFDYEKWLYIQGVHSTGYIRKSTSNRLLSEASFTVDGIRQLLQQLIVSSPEISHKGLLQALTIGYKSEIGTDAWQILRNTGTSHLMAISGLHIGLVAGLVFYLIRWLIPASVCMRLSAPQCAAIFSLLAAGFYAMLAGFAVPTQRAFIMLLVVMSAVLLKRPAFSSNTLALSLIAVLLFDPVAVLSAGFWLSFLAVLIIALVSFERLNRSDHWIKNWLRGVRIQWLIALGMLPLSLLLFQQGSIVSPLANMLAIPLVGLLVVPVTLLAGLFSLVSVELGSWLFMRASDLLTVTWSILEWLSQSSLASWQRSATPNLHSFLAICGAALLLMPRGFPMRIAGVILLAPMLLYQPDKPAADEFWVTVLDVGQGLSVLVQTGDRTLLYDTGARLSQRFDIGQRVIAPYLNYIGVRRLDVLLVSHEDNDHAGGAEAILQQFPVSRVLGSLQTGFGSVQSAIPCQAGDSWNWDGVNFQLLHPDKYYKKTNNRSCVLKISNAQYGLLLAGDIERKIERNLLQHQAKFLQSDVLVVPHHGSNTSSSSQWLEQVKPALAIVSAGFKNRFKHPTQKVLSRYQQMGSWVLNTATDGAIQIKFNEKQDKGLPQVLRHRKDEVHYWNHRL